MDILECIKTRSSVRKFSDQPITDETLHALIEVARFAPSWKNTQTTHYIAIRDRACIDELIANSLTEFKLNQYTADRCNILMVTTIEKGICGFNADGTPTTSKGDHWEMFDTGVAAQTLCLAAHGMGIGTVIMGIFDEAEMRKTLGLDDSLDIGCIIAMGYPSVPANPRVRKEVSELLSIR